MRYLTYNAQDKSSGFLAALPRESFSVTISVMRGSESFIVAVPPPCRRPLPSDSSTPKTIVAGRRPGCGLGGDWMGAAVFAVRRQETGRAGDSLSLTGFPPSGRVVPTRQLPPFLYHPDPNHGPLSGRGRIKVCFTFIRGGKTKIWTRRRQGTPNPYRLNKPQRNTAV